MEQVKHFLLSHSSASISVISNRLEIAIKDLHPLLLAALQDLGINNYRIIYTITSGMQVILCTEKNKKDLEDKLGLKSRIYAVQRITEDINSFYNTELQERDSIITEENKNGGMFLPIYSNTGAFPQGRREYNAQTKLNFKPKKAKQDYMFEEIKEKSKEAVAPSNNLYELEEEGVVKIPVSKRVAFNRIVDIDIDDMADIIDNDTDDIQIIGEKRVIKFKEPEPEKKIVKDVPLPVKREAKRVEPVLRKQFKESIIPVDNSKKKARLSQPPLASFFQKN